MAGSVHKYETKSGTKYMVMLEIGENGKRKQKKKMGFKTKKEAKAYLAEQQTAINKGLYIEQSKLLYKDYLADWFIKKKFKIGVQTAKVYEEYLNSRIFPDLGNIPLSSISPKDLEDYQLKLTKEGLSPWTIKKIFDIIKNSLKYAKDLELIYKNPASKIELSSKKNKELYVWDEEEVSKFLKTAKNTSTHPYYTVFVLAIFTGMRRGEILGLRWKDINFKNNTITVNQTLSRDGKEILNSVKTQSSRRIIDISDQNLIDVLIKQRQIVLNHKDKYGESYIDKDLVVCSELGNQLNPSNIRRKMNQLIEISGVSKINFHSLRHTHATLLLSQGVSPKVIQERLGHSSIKVTLDIYSHVLPAMQKEAIQKLGSIIKIK